ncbi:hypothetical protein FRB90_011566 [Tulasnella sp. 427]|nr:hypothetical protein FRB90_011566 [Tulasnella sp. 427]
MIWRQAIREHLNRGNFVSNIWPAIGSPILRKLVKYRTVCTLSRFFHQLANPFRFQEVNARLDNGTATKLSQFRDLLDLLEAQSEVGTWIKTLSVGRDSQSFQMNNGSTMELATMEHRLHKIIPRLRNLVTLRCGFVTFSSELFLGILNLAQLRRLELEDFQVSDADHDPDGDPNWSSIQQSGPSIRTITETLAELTYWPHLFPGFRPGTSLMWIICAYIPHYTFASLRRLHMMIPPSDTEVVRFVRFGEQCPNLATLVVSWNFLDTLSEMIDRLVRSGFGERHFPALEQFDGPLALAPLFTRGRPVHTVISDMFTQLGGTDRGGDAPTLAESIAGLKPSVPLRVLHIIVSRWSDTDLVTVAENHQGIEDLTYECLGEQPMVWSDATGAALRKMTKLKRLTLDNAVNDVPEEEDGSHPLASNMLKACSSLDLLTISWLGIWRNQSAHRT